MDQDALRSIIEQMLTEMNITEQQEKSRNQNIQVERTVTESVPEEKDEFIPDITEIDIRRQYLVQDALHMEEYAELKYNAPCRLGIGKAGARIKTIPRLQFQAAHSAAQDAVFNDVDQDFVNGMNLFTVSTQCSDKDVYLTRPDLGKKLSDEGRKLVEQKCKKGIQVQIFVADGLSSAAVAANVADLLPAIQQGLQRHGINYGEVFFVKYGRVGVMDEVSELIDAQVTCVLIGERPGLITAESMSAYIGYRCTVGMPEARRTVMSNIHRSGTIPAEAGAHIADIIKKILDNKVSGTDLKL